MIPPLTAKARCVALLERCEALWAVPELPRAAVEPLARALAVTLPPLAP